MTIKKLNSAEDKSRVESLYKFENELRAEGYKLIAGVDEAGRGSLVGPVVIGAVILPPNLYLERLNDSKKISAKIREKLFDEITAQAISYSIVEVGIEEIDAVNIYQATKNGMLRAVQNLKVQPEYVLVDAMKLELENTPARAIIHGDALSATIAAASILAKVYRDRLADEWAKNFPAYGFEKNRGYGTKKHLAAIKNFGFCELHRKSFNPVKSIIENSNTRS